MDSIKFFKVTSLPAVLEPNSVYFVNTAGSLNIHISDNTGSNAIQLSGNNSTGGGLIPFPVRKETPSIVGDLNAFSLSTLGLITRRLYVIPFTTPRLLSLSGLRINVRNSSSNSTVKIGIYSNIKINNGNDNPYQLLSSVENLSATSNGDKTEVNNFIFQPNTLYWFGLITNSAPSLRAVDLNCLSPLGRFSNSNTAVTHLYKNMSIFELPTIAPTDLTSGSGDIPGIYLVE